MDKVQFGLNVKHFREQSGLSIFIASCKASIDPKQLRGIERGRWNPTLETIFRIAEAFEVEPNEFFINCNRELHESKGLSIQEQIDNILRTQSYPEN